MDEKIEAERIARRNQARIIKDLIRFTFYDSDDALDGMSIMELNDLQNILMLVYERAGNKKVEKAKKADNE